MMEPSRDTTPEALAAAFRANPDRIFSDREAEALIAASDYDIWAAKAAALHCFRRGDLERALAFSRSVMEREPSAETVKNVAVTLRDLGRHQEAVDWIEVRKDLFDPI